MSVDEFRQLSAAEQRALLAALFQRRLELAKNIHVASTSSCDLHKYLDGQIGEKVTSTYFDRFRLWRLNNSYRMDSETYKDRGAPDPAQTVSSAFYADEGFGRYTVRQHHMKAGVGRIDTAHDPIVESNRYAYWLDGDFPHKEFYLFRYLLDHREEWGVEAAAEGDAVTLTVPWQPWFSDKPLGERRFLLDPQKGFLPVQGHSRWDRTLGNGKPSWRVEDFVVEESQLVGDVWMPTKLREEVWASSVADQIAVYEIEASDFKVGTVTAEDLHVAFTEGMDIVDAVKGVNYIADANGNPAGPVKPVLGAPLAKPPEQGEAATSRRYAVTLISAGVFVCLVAWLWLRQRRRRAGPT